MLLRRITQHVKEQNWFAVALDFLIVVIGVGAAMLGQQWISNGQQRADMRVAEIAVQSDLLDNYSNAKERLAVANCRAEAYQAIATQLLGPNETWVGMPRVNEVSTFGGVLPNLLRSPNRGWGSRHWTAGLARGTFDPMDEEQRSRLDETFQLSEAAQEFQQDIFTLQGQMKALAVTTTIGQSDRLRYYDMLGELDDKSGVLELISTQIIERIEAQNIELSDADIQTGLEYIAEFNERAREVYGDCFSALEWPIYDRKNTTETAP